jgi:hypothetical protein
VEDTTAATLKSSNILINLFTVIIYKAASIELTLGLRVILVVRII